MSDAVTLEIINNNILSNETNNNIFIDTNINEIIVSNEENLVTVSQSINELTIADVGVQGPPGPQGNTGATGEAGAKGDTGATGGVGPLSFIFEQQSNSASWTVTHNLGYYPNVSIKEYGGTTIEGEIQYINANSLVILFSIAISGYAYLS